MSTHGPQLVVLLHSSVWVDDATASAASDRAGDELHASSPLLPAAATTKIPVNENITNIETFL